MASASTTRPMTAPVSAFRPLGTSTERVFAVDALIRSMIAAAGPLTGRSSPVPNNASMTSAASGQSPVASITPPGHRSRAIRASPLRSEASPRSATVTSRPSAMRRRAATNPSPPLLPGPARTRTGPSAPRPVATSATAFPAASMRVMPGTPAAIARASALAICAAVSNSFMSASRKRGLDAQVFGDVLKIDDAGKTPLMRYADETRA